MHVPRDLASAGPPAAEPAPGSTARERVGRDLEPERWIGSQTVVPACLQRRHQDQRRQVAEVAPVLDMLLLNVRARGSAVRQ